MKRSTVKTAIFATSIVAVGIVGQLAMPVMASAAVDNMNDWLAGAPGNHVVMQFENAVTDILDAPIPWTEIVSETTQAQWEAQPANLNLLADVTDTAVVWALKTKGFDPNTEDSQGTRAEKIGIVLRDFDAMSGYVPGFGEVEGVANGFGPRGFVNPLGASNAFWAGHGN